MGDNTLRVAGKPGFGKGSRHVDFSAEVQLLPPRKSKEQEYTGNERGTGRLCGSSLLPQSPRGFHVQFLSSPGVRMTALDLILLYRMCFSI